MPVLIISGFILNFGYMISDLLNLAKAEVDKEKIFEKFRRADDSLTRETAYSELGLAISKELAAMLAGAIGIESDVGKGSTFWLDIPVAIAKSEDKISAPIEKDKKQMPAGH